MSTKPLVFISYAHADEPDKPVDGEVKWFSFVQKSLQPAVKGGIFDLWVDRQMDGGVDWNEKIEQKLRSCDIFILLVSNYSMASDYVVDIEIPIIRARQQKGENVHFYPLILTPTPDAGLDVVRDKNLRPRDGKPFSSFSHNDRLHHMAEATNEIAKIARRVTEQKAAALPSAPAAVQTPAYVHLTGLPETAYERLVGRDAELKRLDAAWADSNTNILSLVAEGGAGKSALVNEWLGRMRAENYRGAEAVLGWSFYSQGTKERATAADQFLSWALDRLGITREIASATAKGEAIAEAMRGRRVLLVLDGVEPLQHGPDGQQGQLKDQGLRALLRHFANMPPGQAHGLIVLTSRLAITDIARHQDGGAPVVDVEKLSDAAGAALLRDNGVWGTDREREAAAYEFGGHPLALGLLASFLKETQSGDVRRRDRIGAYFADGDNPRHGHAKRVMESYEREWLAGQPVLLAILHIVGLFDRPASSDCLAALRAAPVIDGLTEGIVALDDGKWQRAVARLREVRLLAPIDPVAPVALDAHPLVREWFGERLRLTNETAWKAAHGQLYEHLRDTTHEGGKPTLEDLAPLYQAITHGCRAGRHQEALDAIYTDRICRRRLDGSIEFYSDKKLGAVSSDLAAITWFFGRPYETPVTTLTAEDQTWVLHEASAALRAQGRFAEALPALRKVLRFSEDAGHWINAAIGGSNLSQIELLVGEIPTALASAERCVAHADRCGDAFQMMTKRITHAVAFHAAGRHTEAEALFKEAEQRQEERDPTCPLLYSVQGYEFCDLLMAKGDYTIVRDRTTQALKINLENNWLFAIALDTLMLGRSILALSIIGATGDQTASSTSIEVSGTLVKQAVVRLRASGSNAELPRGLLASAAFHRSIGDWDSAARDLDETEEIAEPGPMQLHLCNAALERARFAFARIEAFAPLNGCVETSPPEATCPDASDAALLKEDVQSYLATARGFITKCGYHRRNEELAELEDVLAGKRRFADLPIRV